MAAMLVIAAAVGSAAAQGFRTLEAYEGVKFPTSAGVWASLYDPYGLPNPTSGHNWGPVLDVDGDRLADVSELSANPGSLGQPFGEFFGVPIPSPSDSDVWYLYRSNASGPNLDIFTHSIIRIDRTGSDLAFRREYTLPVSLDNEATASPGLRPSIRSWTGIAAIRRTSAGEDAILVTAREASISGFTLTTKFAVLFLDPDSGTTAFRWSAVNDQMNGYEMVTMDDRGNGIARKVEFNAPSGPYNSDQSEALYRVTDSNGDFVPDTLDVSSAILDLAPNVRTAYGAGDLDYGTDRAMFGASFPFFYDLDSFRRPIPGSERSVVRLEDGVFTWSSRQPFMGRDGQVADVLVRGDGFCPNGFDIAGSAVWTDTNFDGQSDNLRTDPIVETASVVSQCDFGEIQIYFGGHAIPELTELEPATQSLTFRDFGEYPGGVAFRFRFGSKDFESVAVRPDGVVSFGAPVTGPASRASLAAAHGAIACAWSDEWDTSSLRLYAGYVPMTTSFRTGEPVHAFAIEWRHLRREGWTPDRYVSMRLLLFSDGTFRTDVGSLTELSDMNIVTGYAGPGAHLVDESVDVSSHSWGGQPAGSTGERVLAEAFGPANPIDIHHAFYRWTGYPERIDPAAPAPVLVSPQLKGGKKIVLRATGSNIQPGAILVVDGSESFALAKKGAKWVVTAGARSQPSGRSVRAIFSDGSAHSIVAINPDGESSEPESLP